MFYNVIKNLYWIMIDHDISIINWSNIVTYNYVVFTNPWPILIKHDLAKFIFMLLEIPRLQYMWFYYGIKI